ncbi:hypothetical protein ABK040_000195 [Willaertia magna]
MRRNRPGTKKKELYAWEKEATTDQQQPNSKIKNNTDSNNTEDENNNSTNDTLDNSIVVQEMIQRMIRKHPKKIKKIISIPKSSNENQEEYLVDKEVWIYEHMRQFLIEINQFILHLKDVCTKETQPEMKISQTHLLGENYNNNDEGSNEELLYYCPVFNPPQLVSAIDYMVHIHTQSTNVLMDVKLFPSRNTISKKAIKEIKTLCRRIYRIFAFSYFVHKNEFLSFEKKFHLAERFQKFVKKFDLMSSKDFLIPEEAFGNLE